MGVEVLVMARTKYTTIFRGSVRLRHSHTARWQLLAFQTRGTLGHLQNVSLSFTTPCCPPPPPNKKKKKKKSKLQNPNVEDQKYIYVCKYCLCMFGKKKYFGLHKPKQ